MDNLCKELCIHYDMCSANKKQICDYFIFNQEHKSYQELKKQYNELKHRNEMLKSEVEKLTKQTPKTKKYIIYYASEMGFTSTIIINGKSEEDARAKFFTRVGGYTILKIDEVKF